MTIQELKKFIELIPDEDMNRELVITLENQEVRQVERIGLGIVGQRVDGSLTLGPVYDDNARETIEALVIV